MHEDTEVSMRSRYSDQGLTEGEELGVHGWDLFL